MLRRAFHSIRSWGHCKKFPSLHLAKEEGPRVTRWPSSLESVTAGAATDSYLTARSQREPSTSEGKNPEKDKEQEPSTAHKILILRLLPSMMGKKGRGDNGIRMIL